MLTGGGGFLGSFIAERLARENPAALLVPRGREIDLRDAEATRAYLRANRPDVIIHAAAVVGGIGANRAQPGRFFYDNAVMGIHLIEEARLAGVEKFVCLGTACAYPKFTPIPFREDEIWNGYPEETNAPYGLAKRMLLVQLQAYREQYGFNGLFLIPANLYGPRDNFDLETSHVIPAMIRKFDDAVRSGSESVVLWGDGSPTRDFLYVEDAADAIARATAVYNDSDPVNLGSGAEISIASLAVLIAERCGFRGRIEWDTSRPNGQSRRRLDTTRARERFSFVALTSMEEGMARTIAWYRSLVNEKPIRSEF